MADRGRSKHIVLISCLVRISIIMISPSLAWGSTWFEWFEFIVLECKLDMYKLDLLLFNLKQKWNHIKVRNFDFYLTRKSN